MVSETSSENKSTRTVFDPITVKRQGVHRAGTKYRASVPVPESWSQLDDVLGSHTSEGPWVEAYGATHEEALDALMRTIGRLCVTFFGGTADLGN